MASIVLENQSSFDGSTLGICWNVFVKIFSWLAKPSWLRKMTLCPAKHFCLCVQSKGFDKKSDPFKTLSMPTFMCLVIVKSIQSSIWYENVYWYHMAKNCSFGFKAWSLYSCNNNKHRHKHVPNFVPKNSMHVNTLISTSQASPALQQYCNTLFQK